MAHPTQHDPHTPGFLPFRALAEKPSRWMGLAALMAWADLLLCFEGVLRDQVLEQGGLVHDPFFLGLTAAAAVTLGLFALLRKAPQGRQMAERLLRPNALMGFAALGALVSAAAVGLTSVAQAVDAWAPALLGVVAGIAAALVYKAVTMAKEMKKYRQELEKIRDNDKYLLDIVQEGKTVRIECKDVNTENVELIAEDKEG